MLTGTRFEPIELLHGGQCDAKTKQDLRTLRERSVAGCKRGCAVVTLTGSSEEIGEALACLPSLPAVSQLSVYLEGTLHSYGPGLQQLAHEFPENANSLGTTCIPASFHTLSAAVI